MRKIRKTKDILSMLYKQRKQLDRVDNGDTAVNNTIKTLKREQDLTILWIEDFLKEYDEQINEYGECKKWNTIRYLYND